MRQSSFRPVVFDANARQLHDDLFDLARVGRKPGESVVMGGNITKGNRVRLAFDAPGDVSILRAELAVDIEPELADSDLEGKPAEWQEAVC